MIELQSVGLKFGLATKKESEYKYSESFKERKLSLFSAVRESLAFWNFGYSEMLPLVMPAQLLLPWQVISLKATGYDIRKMSIFEILKPFVIPLRVMDSDAEFEKWANTYDSYSPIDSNILSAFDFDTQGRIKFKGQVAITDKDGYDGEGLYCLVLPGFAISEDAHLEDNEAYTYIISEPFSFSRNVDDYATLLFGNNVNLSIGNGAEIDFSDGFFFKMLLPSQIGRPNYVFEETLTERQGYKFIEHQVSKKTYDISFPANESMCDTLRIARLCCNRQIKSEERYHDIIAMDMSVEWLEQGDIASVKMTIEEDNIINHNGGYIGDLGRGDFSEDDFNNDFFDVEKRVSFPITHDLYVESSKHVSINNVAAMPKVSVPINSDLDEADAVHVYMRQTKGTAGDNGVILMVYSYVDSDGNTHDSKEVYYMNQLPAGEITDTSAYTAYIALTGRKLINLDFHADSQGDGYVGDKNTVGATIKVVFTKRD